MENYTIYHDLFIKSSANKVYEAITMPEHLINWWPLQCSGTPKEGNTYNFNFTDAYDWYGEVVKAKKDKSFHIKMTKSDDNWNQTSFGFDLDQAKNGVTLKFWHINWPECNDEYRQSSYCWAILLYGLKNYVEKGVIIPFEERE